MNMSMDKPIALNRAEGTRGPQVEKCKNDVKKKLGGGGWVWGTITSEVEVGMSQQNMEVARVIFRHSDPTHKLSPASLDIM